MTGFPHGRARFTSGGRPSAGCLRGGVPGGVPGGVGQPGTCWSAGSVPTLESWLALGRMGIDSPEFIEVRQGS
jgi:hypothetical protein